MIDVLTDNRNKAAQEIKHILSSNSAELASPGSASWAFTKTHDGWQANTTMPLEDADIATLEKLVEELVHLVKPEMERPSAVMLMPWDEGRGLRVEVEIKVGNNWCEMKEVA